MYIRSLLPIVHYSNSTYEHQHSPHRYWYHVSHSTQAEVTNVGRMHMWEPRITDKEIYLCKWKSQEVETIIVVEDCIISLSSTIDMTSISGVKGTSQHNCHYYTKKMPSMQFHYWPWNHWLYTTTAWNPLSMLKVDFTTNTFARNGSFSRFERRLFFIFLFQVSVFVLIFVLISRICLIGTVFSCFSSYTSIKNKPSSCFKCEANDN